MKAVAIRIPRICVGRYDALVFLYASAGRPRGLDLGAALVCSFSSILGSLAPASLLFFLDVR